ncbi:MAG TPA: sterol desaturase family protein [Nitrospiria bacterium]
MAIFFGIFILMATWEVISPRRILTTSKPKRWIANIGIVILNTFLVRMVLNLAPVGTAIFASEQGWGILNLVERSQWVLIPVAIISLDFVIYLQHIMFHAIPLLWRLHMVHHTDLDFDVTTGARFHPIEILLSTFIKMGAVLLIGASPVSVFTFEALLNGTSMFNHGNVRIPKSIDRGLRWFIVTPDMHRVHHSIYKEETNSNFGFNLPWWDRLMGTYTPVPREGHTGMTIGLSQYRNPDQLSLLGILTLPFVGVVGPYPLNRGDQLK